MSVKYKALARVKGPWAPSTLYLRGDVASYLGALYAAKDPFTSGAEFDATKWDLVLAAPAVQAAPTLRSVGAPLITQGAGLPSFAGRVANDLHYDTSTGKTSILAGAPTGTPQSDSFTRADTTAAQGIGTAPTGGVWAAPPGDPANGRIVGNKVQGSGIIQVGGGAQEVTATLVQAPDNTAGYGAFGISLYLCASATAVGYQVTVNGNGNYQIYKDGANLLSGVTNNGGYSPAINRSDVFTASIDGSGNIRLKITRGGDGVTFDYGIIYTDATPLTADATRTYVGAVAGSATQNYPAYFDNFAGTATGTLAWTFTEPIYLQAQLVSGNVAVATHVLKPGVRVPTDTTLREMILRCDTAPTGAALTVQAERFNNGVSQGIIATASIAVGDTVGSVTGLSAGCAKGDIIHFNVTQVGSTVAGADLMANLDFH